MNRLVIIYIKWNNVKKSYKNNKFKKPGTTWDEQFETSGKSYSVSDIQDHFKYIIKKHEALTDKPPIQTYVNIIQNKVTFKIKSGCFLELLTPEAMKLLGDTLEKITNDKMLRRYHALSKIKLNTENKICDTWTEYGKIMGYTVYIKKRKYTNTHFALIWIKSHIHSYSMYLKIYFAVFKIRVIKNLIWFTEYMDIQLSTL